MRDSTLARIAGILYLVTFVTSIPALALKTPLLAGEPGAEAPGVVAIILELILAAACVGTAVALYPVLRRGTPVRAIGFVASRVAEAGLVLLGVAALAALLRGPADALIPLRSLHDAAFMLGPGTIPAANALLLATALLRTQPIPRAIPIIGLAGAPLLLVSVVLTLAGVLDQVSPVAGLLAAPIAVWEFAVGVWLILGRTAGVGDATEDGVAPVQRTARARFSRSSSAS